MVSVKTTKKAGKKAERLSEAEYRYLKGIYTSLNNPAAYDGISSLRKASGLPLSKVREFLESSKVYTNFKAARQKFKRLKVRNLGVNHIWSVDVAFMNKFSKENDGVQYLLIAFDVLTRFLRVHTMKSKSAQAAFDAFSKMIIIKKPTSVPIQLWTDQGKEFKGHFRKHCEELEVEVYSTYGDSKSAIAERFVRTLKKILYKFFEESGSCRYLGHLQQFVRLINARVYSSIGLAPADVSKQHVRSLVLQNSPNAYDKRPNSGMKSYRTPPKLFGRKKMFRKKQTVRLFFQRKPFQKSYKQRFTDEVFTVARVSIPSNRSEPITYVLHDNKG